MIGHGESDMTSTSGGILAAIIHCFLVVHIVDKAIRSTWSRCVSGSASGHALDPIFGNDASTLGR